MLTLRLLGRDEGDVLAVEQDPAGVGLLEAGDHPQGGGLAAAARAEHREELAGGDLELTSSTARTSPNSFTSRSRTIIGCIAHACSSDHDREQVVDVGAGRARDERVAERRQRHLRAVLEQGRARGRCRPSAARSTVSPSTIAPAWPVPPSEPSVSRKTAATGRALELERGGDRGLLVRARPRRSRRRGPGSRCSRRRSRASPCRARTASRDRRSRARGWRAAGRPGAPRPRAWSRSPPGAGRARCASSAIASQAVAPVTSSSVWISAPCSSGDSAAARLEVLADRRRDAVPEPVAVEDRDRVGGPRAVGDGRVGDRVEVVAGDVGDGQVDQPRRCGRRGQPAALERRDVLAHRVDLDDADPRREQQLVQVALLRRARRRPAAGWRAPSCRR